MRRLRRPPAVEFPFQVIANDTKAKIPIRMIARSKVIVPLVISCAKVWMGSRRRKMPERSIRMDETDSSSRLPANPMPNLFGRN